MWVQASLGRQPRHGLYADRLDSAVLGGWRVVLVIDDRTRPMIGSALPILREALTPIPVPQGHYAPPIESIWTTINFLASRGVAAASFTPCVQGRPCMANEPYEVLPHYHDSTIATSQSERQWHYRDIGLSNSY